MKLVPGFYYSHFDGKRLWLDGRKTNDTLVVKTIKSKHAKISVNNPATGTLEVLENGEYAYWPTVEMD